MGSEEKGRGGSINEERGNSCCFELALQELTNYKNTLRFISANTKNFHTKTKNNFNILLSNTKRDKIE